MKNSRDLCQIAESPRDLNRGVKRSTVRRNLVTAPMTEPAGGYAGSGAPSCAVRQEMEARMLGQECRTTAGFPGNRRDTRYRAGERAIHDYRFTPSLEAAT